jgi:hypothetical protein
VVSRFKARSADPDRYLVLDPTGTTNWTEDLSAATPFVSMHEAMPAAVGLPSDLRSDGVPLSCERALGGRTH